MTRSMRALPAPMSAMVAVTMPALGAIAGSGMLPTLAIDIAVMHITAMGKRPDLMVIMMRRRHADADTDTGGSQRGHGKGGGGETQHGKKMLGGFHGQSFLINGDYIPSNGPDQPRLTNHLYGFVSAWPKRGHNTLQRCLFQAWATLFGVSLAAQQARGFVLYGFDCFIEMHGLVEEMLHAQ